MKKSFWIRLAALVFLVSFAGSDARSVVIGPLPPQECTMCRPCTRDSDCGVKDGTLQGFCIDRPFYPCGNAYQCLCR